MVGDGVGAVVVGLLVGWAVGATVGRLETGWSEGCGVGAEDCGADVGLDDGACVSPQQVPLQFCVTDGSRKHDPCSNSDIQASRDSTSISGP